ncbi:hypothetical protein [Streptomyces sp. 11x1]|uniref:hypothetical protein n=1 Tax=Streptomyces sp. 11x1 TaxID=3038642 RepID=UPI00292D8B77|nr:hypothetical protein [Streptomyces sp. 11x1]WNZ14043.1 hypothetical protein P8T65_45135 [Streptomyces sp. 11x1]
MQRLGHDSVQLRALEGEVVRQDLSPRTRTHSRRTVPLAVVRRPRPSQSSITVTPGTPRGTATVPLLIPVIRDFRTDGARTLGAGRVMTRPGAGS